MSFHMTALSIHTMKAEWGSMAIVLMNRSHALSCANQILHCWLKIVLVQWSQALSSQMWYHDLWKGIKSPFLCLYYNKSSYVYLKMLLERVMPRSHLLRRPYGLSFLRPTIQFNSIQVYFSFPQKSEIITIFH